MPIIVTIDDLQIWTNICGLTQEQRREILVEMIELLARRGQITGNEKHGNT